MAKQYGLTIRFANRTAKRNNIFCLIELEQVINLNIISQITTVAYPCF